VLERVIEKHRRRGEKSAEQKRGNLGSYWPWVGAVGRETITRRKSLSIIRGRLNWERSACKNRSTKGSGDSTTGPYHDQVEFKNGKERAARKAGQEEGRGKEKGETMGGISGGKKGDQVSFIDKEELNKRGPKEGGRGERNRAWGK